MKRRTLINALVFIVTFGIGATVLGYLVWQEGPEYVAQRLQSFGLLPFLGFVALSLTNFVLYSWRWQIITNAHLPKSQHLSLFRIYLHRMSGYAMSYLTPAAQVGGEPVRMAMLTTDKVPPKEATSSVLLDIAFEMVAFVIFIFAGVLMAIAQGFGGPGSFVFIIVGLLIVLGLLLLFFGALAFSGGFFQHLFKIFQLHKIKRLDRIQGAIIDTERMMVKFLAGKKSRIAVIAFLSLAVVSFRVIEVFYIAHFLGFNVNFAQAFLVSTLPGVALLLPVPAGLGLFEGTFAGLFVLLNIPLSAVAFALIIRLRDAAFIFVGVLHMLSQGRKVLERKVFKRGK